MSESLTIASPAGLGLGQAEEIKVNNRWDTLDDILVGLMKEGIHPLRVPTCPQPVLTPEILSSASPAQFGTLFGQFEAWKSYITSVLAGIDGLLLQCENEMNVISVKTRENIREHAKQPGVKKPSEAAIKDMVENQPRFLELKLQHQMAKQQRFMVETESDRYGRGLRIVSRYLKIKELEMDDGQRRSFR
jgi:hypothetical protein